MATGQVLPDEQDLEAIVAAFEAAQADGGPADLADFLPRPDHAQYGEVLRELVRIDLEFAWTRGRPVRVEEYRCRFPAELGTPDALQEIAFEEYRLRRQAGENPSPDEYRRRLGVSVGHWPGALRAAPSALARRSASRLRISPGSAVDEPTPGSTRPAGTASAERDFSLASVARTEAYDEQRPAEAPSLPKAGDTFLGFHLLAELGRGSFGRVFLARQGDLAGRSVVLKIAADIWGESQNLAQLQHTNIVPIYSFHHTRRLQAVCMPYFGPTTLADVLKGLRSHEAMPSSGRELVGTVAIGRSATQPAADTSDPSGVNPHHLPAAARTSETRNPLEGLSYVQAVLWIGSRLADGLAHAHERGILHRDLKPANVLLTDDGEPMLLDFNLAQDTKAPQPDRVGGTLPYMAPEHLEALQDRTKQVDARGDLYALGVILFELLTRQYPFSCKGGAAATLLPALIAERRQGPPSLRPHNPAVTPAVEAIVRRCLEPDPARRYPSAAQLREDLQCQLADLPLRHMAEPSWVERGRKFLRRHPRLISGSTIALVAVSLLLGLGGLYLLRGRTLAARERELARAGAADNLRGFREDLRAGELLLCLAEPDREAAARGARLCRDALDRFQVLSDTAWRDGEAVTLLPDEDRGRLDDEVGETLFWLARATRLTADPGDRGRAVTQALRFNDLAGRYSHAAGRRRLLAVQRALLRDDQDQTLLLASGVWRSSAPSPYLLAQLGKVLEIQALPVDGTRDRSLLAAELLDRGEYRQALTLLQEATRLDPQDALGWYTLGNVYYALAKYEKAADHYGTALALRPGSWTILYQRGRAYLSQKEYTLARADFDAALRLRPDELALYLDRSLARLGLNDLAGALTDLDRAQELGAPQTRLWFMRAHVRRRLGDAAGAARDHAEGLRRQPSDEQSWLARGVARLATDPRGALADFEAALRLNPRSRVALEDKAHVLAERLGRTDEAVAALDRVLDLHPDFVQARAGRGVLLARLGKRDAALRDAEAAVRDDRTLATAYQVAGVYALTSRRQPDDRTRAYRLLTVALFGGYGFDLLDHDRELDPIRNDAEFRRLVEAARALQPAAN